MKKFVVEIIFCSMLFRYVSALNCRACSKIGSAAETCYEQTCPSTFTTCMTTTADIKIGGVFQKISTSECSAPEYCSFTADQTCKITEKALQALSQTAELKNCSISCSPKPSAQVVPTDPPTCDVCMSSGNVKNNCIKEKCTQGLTHCRSMTYILVSTKMSMDEFVTIKGCAAKSECEVDMNEMKELIRVQTARNIPDVVISDFSMKCSSSAVHQISLFVLLLSVLSFLSF